MDPFPRAIAFPLLKRGRNRQPSWEILREVPPRTGATPHRHHRIHQLSACLASLAEAALPRSPILRLSHLMDKHVSHNSRCTYCSSSDWSGLAFFPSPLFLSAVSRLFTHFLSLTSPENGSSISLGRGNLLTHAASPAVSSVTLNPSCSRRRTDCRATTDRSRSSK